MSLAEGDKAPAFALAADGGGTVDSKTLKGKPFVLYFYPKDDTSGYTKEAIAFTERLPEFRKLGVAVVGVSPDSAASHDKFKAKHKLGFPLGADEDRKVCEAFGVWVEKSMYGRKYMGVERATFLVGADGRIARAWRKVKVPGHVDEVLEAARAL
jgi:thioredoxin-dependent peroxiredoxin